MSSDLVTIETLSSQQKKLIAKYQERAGNDCSLAEPLLALCTGLKVLEELRKEPSKPYPPSFGG
jgi:hypothetical protein